MISSGSICLLFFINIYKFLLQIKSLRTLHWKSMNYWISQLLCNLDIWLFESNNFCHKYFVTTTCVASVLTKTCKLAHISYKAALCSCYRCWTEQSQPGGGEQESKLQFNQTLTTFYSNYRRTLRTFRGVSVKKKPPCISRPKGKTLTPVSCLFSVRLRQSAKYWTFTRWKYPGGFM